MKARQGVPALARFYFQICKARGPKGAKEDACGENFAAGGILFKVSP
jgi:hypothetical protein